MMRSQQISNEEAELKGATLHSVPDNRLLAYLFSVYRQLRIAPASQAVEKAFITELLHKRYLRSSIPNVSPLVAAVICDVLRLFRDGERGALSGEGELPFPTGQSMEVLEVISHSFEEAVRLGDISGCRFLIERGSACRVMSILLPYCRDKEHVVDTLLTPLFQALPLLSGGSVKGPVSATSTVEISRVLVDIIVSRGTICPLHLLILLSETVQESAFRKKVAGVVTTSSVQPAARVLMECLDVVRIVFETVVVEKISSSIASLSSLDNNSTSGESYERRRAALNELSLALQFLVATTEISVEFPQTLLPRIDIFLDHNNPDVRHLLLRGLGAVYLCRDDVIPVYQKSFQKFISHAGDIRQQIRIEIIQFIGKLVSTAKTQWVKRESSIVGPSSFSLEKVWPSLYEELELRLTDSQPAVRRQAVSTLCDCIQTAPELGGFVDLEKAVGLRTDDKNPKVRETSLEKLGMLYRSMPEAFPWIGNTVMSAAQLQEDIHVVEKVLEMMLPPLGNGQKKLEKTDSMAAAWIQLCSALSPPAFCSLLRVVSHKASMRAAVARLFQLREHVAKQRGLSGDDVDVATNVHNIQRLLNFLGGTTGSEKKNEWNSLFHSKDMKVARALLRFCQEGNDDWVNEREELRRGLKGRLDNETFAFVEGRLMSMLSLPIRSIDVEELLKEVSLLPGGSSRLIPSLQAMYVCLIASPSAALQIAPVLSALIRQLVDENADLTTETIAAAIAIILDIMKEIPGVVRRLAMTASWQKVFFESQEEEEALMGTLSRLYVGNCPVLLHCGKKERLDQIISIAKKAARCVANFSSVSNKAQSALSSLQSSTLRSLEATSCCEDIFKWVGCVKALSAVAQHLAANTKERQQYIKRLGEWIVQLASTPEKIKKTAFNTKRKSAEEAVKLGLAADTIAKAMSGVALSGRQEDHPTLVSTVVQYFLQALKAASETHSGCANEERRVAVRRAVVQQLVKLARLPASEMVKEMSVAVILSSETDPVIRRVIQMKMLRHIQRYPCDIRYVSLLFLTAMGATVKSEYRELRDVVQRVGDHIRPRQATDGGVSLSSPKAMCCYLEYTIPFLIFFMAHHPVYEEQEEKYNFYAFQRVWHLLMEELLRHGIHCVSFIRSLLSRIKNSRDALQPEEQRIGVLADLATLILHHLLADQEVSAAAAKPYPGPILLPNFFVATSSSQSQDNSSVVGKWHVPPHVPFRPPQGDGEAVSSDDEAVPSTARDAQSYRKRSSRSPPQGSSPMKQRRTEPMVVVYDSSRQDEEGCEADKLEAVRRVVEKLTDGLSKTQLAQLKWKDIKRQVECISCGGPVKDAANNTTSSLQTALEYTKSLLRERYAHASD